jgi:hypothetical protein
VNRTDTLTRSRTPLLLGVAASVAMVAAIAYGMASGGFVDGLRTVLGDAWGRVTMVDLAAGLVMVAAWIAWREGSMRKAVPWWLLLVVTGNLATGIYVIKAAREASNVEEFLVGRATGGV